MPVWKKLLSMLLLLAFNFNVCGYCYNSYQLANHKRHQASMKSKEKDGHLIRFEESELTLAVWEDTREFELDGEMYDIEFSEIVHGEKVFYCKKDSKEDDLKEKKQKSEDDNNSKLLLGYVKIMPGGNGNCLNVFPGDNVNQVNELIVTYSSKYTTLPDLPPEF